MNPDNWSNPKEDFDDFVEDLEEDED